MAFVDLVEVTPVTSAVIAAAIDVHRHFLYKGTPVRLDLEIDLIVEAKVIVEMKSIEAFRPSSPSATPDLLETDRLSRGTFDQLQCSIVKKRSAAGAQ